MRPGPSCASATHREADMAIAWRATKRQRVFGLGRAPDASDPLIAALRLAMKCDLPSHKGAKRARTQCTQPRLDHAPDSQRGGRHNVCEMRVRRHHMVVQLAASATMVMSARCFSISRGVAAAVVEACRVRSLGCCLDNTRLTIVELAFRSACAQRPQAPLAKRSG